MENKVIKDKLNQFSLPPYEEIPDVGLYLEQVSRYINGPLAEFPEMKVTPSMISNYAKAKLFSRINKKTYTRDQIAIIFFITISKSVLSIEYVRTALDLFRSKNYSVPKGYEYFRKELENSVTLFYESGTTKKLSAGLSDDQKMLRNVCTAIAHKMYLERYFESLANDMQEPPKHTKKNDKK
jgi:DNA-binding transcriptional MerR regulator